MICAIYVKGNAISQRRKLAMKVGVTFYTHLQMIQKILLEITFNREYKVLMINPKPREDLPTV